MSFQKLVSNRAAATNNIRETATSPTTSDFWARLRPAATCVEFIRSDSFNCVRRLSRAGTRLKSNAQPIVSAAANRSAGAPMRRVVKSEASADSDASTPGVANCASRIPAIPPRIQRTAFSTSSCRKILQPEAPRATRRLIS